MISIHIYDRNFPILWLHWLQINKQSCYAEIKSFHANNKSNCKTLFSSQNESEGIFSSNNIQYNNQRNKRTQRTAQKKRNKIFQTILSIDS